jgi:PAS domain S-box-containing protein
MEDENKTKGQLLAELAEIRQKMSEMERALPDSRTRDRSVFEDLPTPMWEADLSALMQEIDRLQTSKGKDLPSYLKSHPNVVRNLVSRIEIMSINKAALKLHEAQDESAIAENLNALLVDESLVLLAHQFSLIAGGATTAEFEGGAATLGGGRRFVRVRWVALPGYERTFGRVLVSVADLTERKLAEDGLRESEEKFRLLFEKSPDATFLMEGDLCIDCNQAALKLRRCTGKDQIVGRCASARAPERQPDGSLSSETARQHDEILLRDGFNRFEWMDRASDDEEIWLEITQTIIPIRGRQVTYSVERDIRQRKKDEARLKESEERYRIAIEHSNDGVAMVRGEKHLYVNRRFLDMFGYTRPEEVIGKDQAMLVHPDDLAMVREYSHRRQSGGSAPARYEFRGIRRDGATVHCEASAAAVTYLGEPAVLSYFRDVTERKHAEEALKESEERYRKVVELSPSGIVIAAKGQLQFANQAWAQMVGVESAEDLYGTPVLDFVHPDYRDIVRERVRKIETEKKRTPLLEHKLVRADGSVTEVATIGVPFVYQGGEGVMAFAEDITQRKLAEKTLKKREKELEKKSTSLEEANIALKVLLKHRDEDKRALENAILTNVKELVFPYIEKLKAGHASDTQMAYIGVIESSLNEVISPFLQKMTSVYSHFTPTEVKIANLVRDAKTTKEIADLLNISTATVHCHRDSIRRKLGLNNKKVNLHTYFLSLQE